MTNGRIEWGVRFHSDLGSHITEAETRGQAEAWASHHAEMPGCWAELLKRTVPDWTTAQQYPNAPDARRP